ncbi:hypothetical protein UT300007_02130 [Clostridium sp. CTA-7]
MKNILITGAGPNGFVGRNLKEMLAIKYNIYSPSSKELDLCDYNALEKYISENSISNVIHSAVHNPRTKGIDGEIENNLRMYFNLAKLSTKLEKLIYFGSGAEFDKRFSINMVKEDDIGISIPIDPYGFTKYIMNDNAIKSDNIYNMRLFGIYGKYEYWQSKFISNLCCKAVYDLPLTVRKNCWFDFLYIDDLPIIIEWFIENTPKYKDYNVCYGKALDLVSIAKIVNEVSGKNLEVKLLNTEGFNLSYTANNDRLLKEIPNLRLTDYKSAITKLYKYYYENKDIIDYSILKETR